MSKRKQLLADADQHIADGEQRLTRQRRLIERLAGIGHDTRFAEKLAGEIQAYIRTARAHRLAIRQELEGG